jgi:hypothetical protein
VGFGTQALNDRIMTSLHSKERAHVRREQPVSPCRYDYCTTNKRGKRFVAVVHLASRMTQVSGKGDCNQSNTQASNQLH